MRPVRKDSWYDFAHCTTCIGCKLVAKGQKRSNREAKKPKKTAAERLKADQAAAERQIIRIGPKGASAKG